LRVQGAEVAASRSFASRAFRALAQDDSAGRRQDEKVI